VPVADANENAGPLPYRVQLAGLLALIAAVHLPLLRFGLIYDDGWTLRSNGFLRSGRLELGLLFSPEAMARHIPDAFRPTLVVFDALSLRVLGLEAWAHHCLSIALHLGVCLALERVLRRLEVAAPLRLASVACFGLLAIHAEAIAVISFREDLLAALLALLALLATLRALDSRAATWAVWAGTAMILLALACGAKLSAAPLPAIVLLLAWLRPNPACARLASDRRRLGLVVALLGLGVALALAQTWVVAGGSPYGLENPRILAHRIGLAPVLAASAEIHVGYLQQMLLPIGLSPEYVDRGASWLSLRTLAASALLLALAIGSLWQHRRWPLASFVVLAWMLACLPTSNLIGMPNMRADRFMYLPSLVACVGMAAGLLALGDRLVARSSDTPAEPRLDDQHDDESVDPQLVAALPLALFVLVQGSFGAAEARVYVSNTTLWHEAARRAPDSARARALLGLDQIASARQGERISDAVLEAAEQSCRHAEQLDPLYELPQLCLGSLAIAREDWALAYEHHLRAVELSVDRNDRPIAALAQLSLDLPSEWFLAHPDQPDRQQLATGWLERGLRAYPYSPELHAAAGRVHHRLGEPERALELYRRARSLRPDRWETVAAGVELALDLGDAAAAHHTWWADANLLRHADAATRMHLTRRLAAARAQPDFSLLHSLLDPGVFPDEP
jgi:tetratricopeptide (TPR) repeat protein